MRDSWLLRGEDKGEGSLIINNSACGTIDDVRYRNTLIVS